MSFCSRANIEKPHKNFYSFTFSCLRLVPGSPYVGRFNDSTVCDSGGTELGNMVTRSIVYSSVSMIKSLKFKIVGSFSITQTILCLTTRDNGS